MCTKITTRFAPFVLSICLALSCSMPLLPVSAAHADNLSEAKAALSEAESQLSAVASEYDSIQSKIAEAEAKISETTAKAIEAQNEMLEGQQELGRVVVSAYKNDATNSLVNVFLSSNSLGAFFKNVAYYVSIEQKKAEQINAQRQRVEAFNAALSELDVQVNEQEKLAADAQAKKEEAQRIVSSASSKVASIESERARLEALQKQASSIENKKPAKPSTEASSNTNENWNTKPSGSDSSGSSAPSDALAGGWRTGGASAYGGSSDKTTPNPGITADGSVCDDNSMGVAVPMSWPDYRSYFGRSVEIKYNGKTIIATVNDCGGFGKYGRDLDLQPGVFKALGFQTCQAWGERTITYRFL